jgi:hypothetical protein
MYSNIAGLKSLFAALAALAILGCAQLPQVPSDFDAYPHISTKNLASTQDLRTLVNHVQTQLELCFAKPMYMYTPAPLPIGSLHQTATIADSGKAAQIIFEQRGIQSFLISKLEFTSTPNGTEVQTTTITPQNRLYEPFFSMWIEQQKSGCKIPD